MEYFQDKLKTSIVAGIKKGGTGFIWIMKILVPISFLTLLLDYSGWISKMDFILEPIMGLLSLPPSAALPLIIGMLTGIYGAIAAMMVLPLSTDQMTLIAIFLLISHGLIQEGIIQGKSGFHPLKATFFRLTASVVTVALLGHFFFSSPESAALAKDAAAASVAPAFSDMLRHWCAETAYLSMKIFAIIMALMVLLETMKTFDIITHIVRAINPLLRLMGLEQKVGMMWLTAASFGIAYGGAVIVEEVKEGNFTDEELSKLHLSIGINHAMIEDPALFLPLGISAFWLWIPRLAAAIIAAHLAGVWYRIRNRRGVTGLQKSLMKS